MKRRTFLEGLIAAFPLAALGEPTPQSSGHAVAVEHGADRFREDRSFGGRFSIAYKVSTRDTGGGLLILEQTMTRQGGPPRHLHHFQEEWFYVIEGDFLVEVGEERTKLGGGDSLLAPRAVPHVWAHVGDSRGRLLVGFQPAGEMEVLLRQIEGDEPLQVGSGALSPSRHGARGTAHGAGRLLANGRKMSRRPEAA